MSGRRNFIKSIAAFLGAAPALLAASKTPELKEASRESLQPMRIPIFYDATRDLDGLDNAVRREFRTRYIDGEPAYIYETKATTIYTVPPHTGVNVRVPKHCKVTYYDPEVSKYI